MVFAVPDRVATSFVVFHPYSIIQPTFPSPKGEGFTDPLSGTLKPADRDEYLYNAVAEIEFGRYSSDHKIIIFDKTNPNTYESAIVIHANLTEVRVTRLLCVHP